MKKSHIIGILMIIAAGLTITMAVGNTSQYVNFSKAAESPDREFHIVGQWVKDKGLIYNPEKDPNYFAFYLKDDHSEVRKVVLHNNKPQDFEKSEKIVVVGKITSVDFEASSILMKCPSKYADEQVKAQQASVLR